MEEQVEGRLRSVRAEAQEEACCNAGGGGNCDVLFIASKKSVFAFVQFKGLVHQPEGFRDCFMVGCAGTCGMAGTGGMANRIPAHQGQW